MPRPTHPYVAASRGPVFVAFVIDVQLNKYQRAMKWILEGAKNS